MALQHRIEKDEAGSQWSIREGLILYKQQVFLLPTYFLIHKIIGDVRNSTHEGIQKTIVCLKVDFYWKGLKVTVKEFIQLCSTCQH